MSATEKKRNVIVLVDMDGVIADLELGSLNAFRAKNPDEPFVPLEDRRGIWIHRQYAELRPDLADKFFKTVFQEGLFGSLPEVPGAMDGLKALQAMENVEVFLCTSPPPHFGHTVRELGVATEKYQWVEQHLGVDWLKRIVLTLDKTVVGGHILLEDNPNIQGAEKNPSWVHILFTAPHNTTEPSPKGGWIMESWDQLEKLKEFIKDIRTKLNT